LVRPVSRTRIIFRLLIAAFLGGFVLSCASYTEETKAMREAYSRRDWDGALKALKESGSVERSQDSLVWRLEAATIHDRKGDFSKSKSLFLEADGIADELYTTSVTKTATSFVMSDASADYEGEDYEKVAIHSMLAHQLLGQGRLDDARISARKIGTKLNEINQKYDEKHKNKYGEDAHGRYLSGVIYEARQEWDSAIVEYWKAIELYQGEFKEFVNGGVPDELVRSCYRLLALRKRDDRVKQLREKFPKIILETPTEAVKNLEQKAEIIAVHELGRVAPKTTGEFLLPFGKQIVRFSFPKLTPRTMYVGLTGIQVEGHGLARADNTLYMDKIAYETLENRRGRLIAKSMTRLLLKGQINDQAKQHFGPLGGLIANVATAATETADTRSWTLLPQGFFISRMRIPAGSYDIAVKTAGESSGSQKVTLKAGEYVLLRGWN
jgi:hypothetical protein